MNIRKNIDYSEMYKELDMLMAKEIPLMELYCGIGKAVCRRSEKGAAVMASEYLNRQYPDAKGFSPRSIRRMRNFYRTYEDHSNLLSLAMQIGWIQNVVIMEAELNMELREWYMKAALQFDWSKAELIVNIAEMAHERIILVIEGEECCHQNKHMGNKNKIWTIIKGGINHVALRWRSRCKTMLYLCDNKLCKAPIPNVLKLNLEISMRENTILPQYSYSKAALGAFSSSKGMPLCSRR